MNEAFKVEDYLNDLCMRLEVFDAKTNQSLGIFESKEKFNRTLLRGKPNHYSVKHLCGLRKNGKPRTITIFDGRKVYLKHCK